MPTKKIATQIRLNENLYELVKAIAQAEMRSINAQMEYFISEGTAQYQDENFTLGCNCDDLPDTPYSFTDEV